MNKYVSLLIGFLTLSAVATAQQSQKLDCHTDEIHKQMLEKNPGLQAQYDQAERDIAEWIKTNKGQKTNVTYTVPVVVHIMHEYGPEYIPDSHVHAMIDEVNKDFQKLAADTAQIAAAFTGIAGDMDMQFRLATKDPSGNCTNGINRIYDPTFTNHGGCPNGNCGTSRFSWPRDNYLNIWVVKDIGSGAGAYAYLAQSQVPTGLDGVVCRYTQFSPLSQNPNTRTMTHEIGHYFNLYHTWGTTNNQGLPSNCNQDDFVQDTPNCIGTLGGCNLSRTTCSTLDNIQNHMDYSNCPRMFTNGQITRMQAAVSTWRSTLVSPANLLATGTDDASYQNIPTCTPIVEFTASDEITCQGSAINFVDRSFNASYDPATWTYNWSFPGGTPSSSTDRNPTVTYSSTGTFDVTLTVTNTAGTSQPEVKSGYINILPGSGTFIAPYTEKVDDPQWPNSSDPSLVWTRKKPQGSLFQFQRSTNAFYSPPASIYLNNFSFNGTGEFELNTPPIDMSGLSTGSAFLKFRVAYRKKATENEIIFLWASTNCGQTFNLVKILNGNLLSQGQSQSGAFTPADTTDWHFIAEDVSGFAGEPNVIFSFRFGASGGNNLWLDDIAVSDNPNPEPVLGFDMDLAGDFNLYPNPNEGRFRMDFYWDGNDEVDARIVDIVGKSINIDLEDQTIKGWNSIDIDIRSLGLESGLYFLNLKSGESQFTERLIIE